MTYDAFALVKLLIYMFGELLKVKYLCTGEKAVVVAF
jgi:hypothetical protein